MPALTVPGSHEGAVERPVACLAQHHRKAFAIALDTAIDDAILEISDDEAEEEKAREVLISLDEPLWEQIQLNFTEWLLAEGDILVKGKPERVAELLVGPRSPLLTASQRGWLEQYLVPAPLPEIIHNSSGEPLLFHTDHYDVLDWDALSAALAAQADVDGDREAGWCRSIDGADGLTRSRARIESASGGRRVSVTYPTAGLAEQGRVWFDALAGDTVKFRLREVSDPKGMLSKAESAKQPLAQEPTRAEGLDPETMASVIETFIKRNYAEWATNLFPYWAARHRDRRSRARPGGSASKACCAAIRMARRNKQRNKGAARSVPVPLGRAGLDAMRGCVALHSPPYAAPRQLFVQHMRESPTARQAVD